MRLTIRNIIFALPALALGLMLAAAQPANAAPKWQGFYLGVQGGAGIMITEADGEVISVDCPDGCSEANTFVDHTGLGDAGLIYGGQVGYDHMLGKTFLVGLQVSGTWGSLNADSFNISFACGLGCGPGGSSFTDMGVENTNRYSASLRVGGLLNPNTLLYAIGGYSRGKFEASFASGLGGTGIDASFIGSSSMDKNLDGWHAGLGLETKITDSVSLGVEYRYYKFNSASIDEFVCFSCGVDVLYVDANIDPSIHTATLALNFKF